MVELRKGAAVVVVDVESLAKWSALDSMVRKGVVVVVAEVESLAKW